MSQFPTISFSHPLNQMLPEDLAANFISTDIAMTYITKTCLTTRYSVSKTENSILQIFDMGSYHLPYSIMANLGALRSEIMKYNLVQNILEADPFLLFSVKRERGDSAFVFDKHKNQVFVMPKEQKLKGFYNDIDGGMPFWPTHINRKQELVSFLYPDEMKEMLTNEYFGRKNIRDEEANQRLKELTMRLKEEDNPVVVIARLKR